MSKTSQSLKDVPFQKWKRRQFLRITRHSRTCLCPAQTWEFENSKILKIGKIQDLFHWNLYASLKEMTFKCFTLFIQSFFIKRTSTNYVSVELKRQSIYDVMLYLGFFIPLSPLSCHFTKNWVMKKFLT